MGINSKIEWTDATWNPLRGCSRVSAGCENCYAERIAARFCGPGGVFAGFTRMVDGKPHWTGKVEPVLHKLYEPLHWKKPRRIFINSMSDLFHEDVPDDFIDQVFGVMALCPQHTFQILTKRPERMLEVLWKRSAVRADVIDANNIIHGSADFPLPLPNVWLGVSVEDQATADARIPLLLATPAAKRFVSYEPALGPVDFEQFFSKYDQHGEPSRPHLNPDGSSSLNWIIAGGESGTGARPAYPDWFRNVRDQCAEAGVPFFFKQWGEWAPMAFAAKLNGRKRPYDLNTGSVKYGKKSAGALLDGKEHKEFPTDE